MKNLLKALTRKHSHLSVPWSEPLEVELQINARGERGGNLLQPDILEVLYFHQVRW